MIDVTIPSDELAGPFEPDSACVIDTRIAVNVGERADGRDPDILLLHYTGMDSGDAALKWLCCEESKVSCHYFIYEDGRTLQLVPETLRAHHAGQGMWEGDSDTNSRSIGIEIVNGGHPAGLPDFPKVQMDAVADLSKDIIKRWNIAPRCVLAHSDIAPHRKEDPGENFNWGWLASQGVGHWVEPAPMRSGSYFQRGESGQPVEALQAMLSLYGYDIPINGEFCERTELVVKAFQRHFRPSNVDGIADISTVETLHQLLENRG